MAGRSLVRFCLCPLVLAALLTGCGHAGRGLGEVTTATVGDTLIVTTVTPADPPPSLYRFERDLVIGVEEGPEEYVLLRPGAVSADAAGRIFTSDQANGEIRIYDASGIHQVTFGRRGQGPGEFHSNYWGFFDVLAAAGGLVTVEDLPRLNLYDDRGGYLRSFDLGLATSRERSGSADAIGIRWFPERKRLVSFWNIFHTDLSSSERIVLLTEELEVERVLADLRPPDSFYRLPEGGGLGIPFMGESEWCVSGDRIVAWGVSDAYRLDLYDLTRGRWRRAVLRIEPERVTAADIAEFKTGFLERMGSDAQRAFWSPHLERLDYPAVKPYFESLLGDDEGRVWVCRTERVSGPDGRAWYRYDLFDERARWLGIVDTPVQPQYIRGGHAYRLLYDPWPMIERYRLVRTASGGAG